VRGRETPTVLGGLVVLYPSMEIWNAFTKSKGPSRACRA
jgi:hypothetical protein